MRVKVLKGLTVFPMGYRMFPQSSLLVGFEYGVLGESALIKAPVTPIRRVCFMLIVNFTIMINKRVCQVYQFF